MPIDAMPGKCEEASILSTSFYIPCNLPAVRLVHHASDRTTYRMCEACAAHNLRNRGGEDRGPYT